VSTEERLAELRTQLGVLQAQQAAIAAQVSQLSEEDQPVRVNE
jgi:cell division protein FtsB